MRRRGVRALLLWVWLCGLVVGGVWAEEWQEGSGYRYRELRLPEGGRTGFTRLTPGQTGIAFTNSLSDERSIRNRTLLSGSGVAAGDIDGDGWVDLYFCRLDGPNVLYRNLGGWKFEDITGQAGVACEGQDSTGAVFADLNGNGHLDLLVTSLGGGLRIFENNGQGQFKETTGQAGVRSRFGSTSLALADLSGNGFLDVYVANYRPTTLMDQPTTRFQIQMVHGIPRVAAVDGRPATAPDLTNRFVFSPTGEVLELGEPDLIYLNQGQGRFQSLEFTGGRFLDEEGVPLSDAPRDWGLAVQIRDITGNGAPDIYVCNDLFTPDRIWFNDGAGTFRAPPVLTLRCTSTFSMGVDFADIDRNGLLDFFVTDMLGTDHFSQHTQVAQRRPVQWPIGLIEVRPRLDRNVLQLNRGDRTYVEAAYYAGLEASDWSWGPIFLDVDLDGYEDLLIPNGQLLDVQHADTARRIEEIRASRKLSLDEILELVRLYPPLKTPNLLFRNRGDRTFEETGRAWGFATPGISQGMALADLDNDGDLDVVINNLLSEAGIYRNETIAPRVAVRLKGLAPNTQGIGAKIRLYGGAVPLQSQEVISGGRYLSGDDPLRVFAAGSLTKRMRIEVAWRSGRRSVVEGVQANHLYEIAESPGSPIGRIGPVSPISPPLFEDVSHLLGGHRHVEEPFDDFAVQGLLPRKLSQLGPGVAWHDVSGNGWDDLIIGSGRGGRMSVYLNDGQGGFGLHPEGPFGRVVVRDQTGIVGLEGLVFAGSANYEDGLAQGGNIRVYDLGRGVSGESLLNQDWSSGPLALGDVDGDGQVDLFVGGRVRSGRYPEGVASVLLRNEGGRFGVMQRWEELGLVSGAVLSDLTGNGRPELVLAMEWGPVRVFEWEGGRYEERTESWGLSEAVGWWNGVATGDVSGDGRLDIIATNWGLNSRYRTSGEHPRRMYYGEWNGEGRLEVVEAYYHEGRGEEVPDRGYRAVGMALPFVRERVGSFEEYGRASLEEIYGEKLKGAGRVEVKTLASKVFYNRGGWFEGRKLPVEAQWAPGFGVVVGDMDGDGWEDVFISQNFFGVNGDQGRLDGGRGLWLRGDGEGGLEAVPGQVSGVAVWGEGRGAALSDFDGDGRVDLVVTQNGAETRLYRNVGGKPGLRVRLRGGAGNRSGVGGVIRVGAGGRWGPAREVQAGSGYWSQNSAVQVMSLGWGEPERVRVRWAGGRVSEGGVPEGAREIVVDYETGEVERVR